MDTYLVFDRETGETLASGLDHTPARAVTANDRSKRSAYAREPHWCQHPTATGVHSDDRVTVHRGSAPVTWCGYHASQH